MSVAHNDFSESFEVHVSTPPFGYLENPHSGMSFLSFFTVVSFSNGSPADLFSFFLSVPDFCQFSISVWSSLSSSSFSSPIWSFPFFSPLLAARAVKVLAISFLYFS